MPNDKKFNVCAHSVSLVVKTLLFAATIGFAFHIASPAAVHAADGWALIDCYCADEFTSIGEPNKERNEVNVGNKLTWLLVGPTGTKVTIEFYQQDECPGIDPFEAHGPLEETIKNQGRSFDRIVSPKIAQNMGGPGKCYGYKVVCSNKVATQTAPGDPIIEVPR